MTSTDREPETHRPATAPDGHGSAGVAVWPTVLGIVGAVVIGLVGSSPDVIIICAGIYVLAAVTGRPGTAWLGFLASIPVAGLGAVLDNDWIGPATLGVIIAAVIAAGLVRRSFQRPAARAQVWGAVLFSAIAVGALLAGPPLLAGGLLIAGLLGHTAWDVWHHRTGRIVPRPYAEFCAVLDVGLAVATGVALVTDTVAGSIG